MASDLCPKIAHARKNLTSVVRSAIFPRRRPPGRRPKTIQQSQEPMEVGMDAAQLGRRLRAARDRRGLSQQAVADELGLPRTAITNIETGARAVSTLEITKLADLYGQTPAYFLSANEQAEEDLSRRAPSCLPEIEGTPRDREGDPPNPRSLSGGSRAAQAFSTKRPNKRCRTTQASCYPVGDAIRQGEAVAQEERRRLRLGIAPIVNVAETISEQGIWTAATDLPNGLSGLFVNHPRSAWRS